jgi:tetratricopeptide (TPR) repeat protein
MKNYFESEEFKSILSRYETARKNGTLCYLDADDFIDLSDYFLDSNQKDLALQAVEAGIRLHADDDLLQLVRAGVLILMRRFDEASQIVDALDEGNNYDAVYLRGQLSYAVEGDSEKADKYFRRWLEELERDWRGVATGENSAEYDEDEDAVSQEEAEQEVRNGMVHIIMTYSEFSPEEDRSHVRQWLQEYLHSYPVMGPYEADLVVGDIARDEDMLDLVETIYLRFLDHNPYFENAWTILSAAQQGLGKYKEALDSLDFALAINPEDVNAVVTKAHCYYAMMNYKEAIPLFEIYRSKVSASEDLYLAFCYINVHQEDKAISCLQSALSFELSKPMDPQAEHFRRLFEVAEGFRACNRPEQALEINSALILSDGKNADWYMQRAAIFLDLGQYAEAGVCFKTASQYTDSPNDIIFDAAVEYLIHQQFYIASALWEELQKRTEDAAESAAFTRRSQIDAYLALCYFHQKNNSAFLLCLERACQDTPETVKRIFGEYLPDTVPPADYYSYLARELA